VIGVGELTTTVIDAVLLPQVPAPGPVTVTVYVVVTVGFANTVCPVVLESPVAGDQVYVNGPGVPQPPVVLAVKLTPIPVHIETGPAPLGPVIETLNGGQMVTVVVAVEEQPAIVPVTVYVVVDVGFAVTEAPDVADSPVDGDQVYVVAPEAVKVVEFPEQTETADGLTVTTGMTLTVTVEVTVPEQPEVVPVTV